MNNLLLAFGATEITACVILAIFVIAITIFLILVPFKLYMLIIFSGYYVPSSKLISMKYRKLDVKHIVETYIASRKAGLDVSIIDYETHLEAGGNIERLMNAMLLAKQSKINLDLQTAKTLDKSGENVIKIIESIVCPTVYPFSNVIGMSRDKIELVVSGKLTLRANLSKFIGGVQEETLIARVTSEIVNVINNAEYYNIVLENPAIISNVIKGKRLDINAAFDIVSLDITNVRIGENLNLKTIRENAEKKKVEISIETERMKQRGIFEEQQAKIRVQEAKIDLVNQEKEFAKSLYEAVKNKDFEALDYFKLKNLQADTEMRNQIAHPDDKEFDIDSLFDDDDED